MMKNTLFAMLVALLLPLGGWAQEMYAVYDNDKTVTFYYDTQHDSREGTVLNIRTQIGDEDWDAIKTSIKKAVFNPSFADARPTTTAYMFYDLSALLTIDGLEYLNTSNVTDMRYMFYGCSSLTYLVVAHFDTSNVRMMVSMFSGCWNLRTIHFAKNMKYRDWGFISGCSKLKHIYVYDEEPVELIRDNPFTAFLQGEATLHVPTGTKELYQNAEVWKLFGTILEPGEQAPEKYAVFDKDETVTFYYDMQRYSRNGTVLDIRTYARDEDRDAIRASVKKAVFDPSFADARPTTTASMFNDLSALLTIDGMEYLNTSNVTSMGSMFYECSSLTSLDLSHFDTSKVTDMRNMFYGCKSLTRLDLSHFDTSKVTDMSLMFSGCSSLTTLDLSHFDTSKVTDMNNMFYECSSMTSLDLSHFDTSNVTDMNGMFEKCSSLTSLDLSHFNTSNVTSMGSMFHECSSLTRLDLSHFDTKNVDDMMGGMMGLFYKCSNLETIHFAKNMRYNDSYFLSYCNNLEYLYVYDNEPVELIRNNPFTAFSQAEATLYVPAGTKALYQNAEYWKQFGTIVEQGETAVPTISYSEPTEVRRYDMGGRRTKAGSTAKHLIIEQRSDGTTRKVLTQ